MKKIFIFLKLTLINFIKLNLRTSIMSREIFLSKIFLVVLLIPAAGCKEKNNVIIISKVTASSRLERNRDITYDEGNIMDKSWKSWCFTNGNGGVGESCEIFFEKPVFIGSLIIKNGYGRIKYYFDNNRIKSLAISNEKGKGLLLAVKDTPLFQTFTFPEKIRFKSMKIKVKEIYKGKKWNDSCISEIAFSFPVDFSLNDTILDYFELFQSYYYIKEIGERPYVRITGGEYAVGDDAFTYPVTFNGTDCFSFTDSGTGGSTLNNSYKLFFLSDHSPLVMSSFYDPQTAESGFSFHLMEENKFIEEDKYFLPEIIGKHPGLFVYNLDCGHNAINITFNNKRPESEESFSLMDGTFIPDPSLKYSDFISACGKYMLEGDKFILKKI